MLRLYRNKTVHGGRYNHRKIISQYSIHVLVLCEIKYLCICFQIYQPSLAALGTKPARLYMHK